MIRLRRVAAPQVFARYLGSDPYATLEDFFGSAGSEVAQRSIEFEDSILRHEAVIDAISSMSHGLCFYCTQAIENDPEPVVRFRPPQGAVDADGQESRRHYWWMAYSWQNLHLACQACQSAKGHKFPVRGHRAERGATDEIALIIDPLTEDPEEHLLYSPDGSVHAYSNRGEMTIAVLALNRRDLVAARRHAHKELDRELEVLDDLIDRNGGLPVSTALAHLVDSHRPFSAMRRQNLRAFLPPRRDVVAELLRLSRSPFELNRYVKADPELRVPVLRAVSTRARLAPSAVRTARISGFRGISNLNLRFGADTGIGSWTALLGENGCGKTSALQAISIAASALTAVDLRGTNFVHPDHDFAEITLELDSLDDARVIIRKDGASEYTGPGPLPLAAFGSHRTSVGTVPRASVRSLFASTLGTPYRTRWIRAMPMDQFNALSRMIRILIKIEDDHLIGVDEDGIYFRRSDGREIRTHDLSSGQQALLYLSLDIVKSIRGQWKAFSEFDGIILIDELSVHLHPRWQMEVVGALRDAFKRAQVVFTTHDPLCLRGLTDGEVIGLSRDQDSQLVATHSLPDPSSLSVDQILTSEHFGLHSAVDPKLENLYRRYYELLSSNESGHRQELALVSSELRGLRQFGDTRRERLALEAADRYIASEKRVSQQDRPRLREATVSEIARIWGEVRSS